MVDRAPAAVQTGEPPDFLFGMFIINYISKWALDDISPAEAVDEAIARVKQILSE